MAVLEASSCNGKEIRGHHSGDDRDTISEGSGSMEHYGWWYMAILQSACCVTIFDTTTFCGLTNETRRGITKST